MKLFKVKSGFTLMELMVYIALLGGIVLIAGQAFSDSSKMRVRTQSMLQSSQNVGNTATLLKEDIAQTGAKSSKAENDPDAPTVMDNFDISHIHDVYMDPDNVTDTDKDSSSFKIGKKFESDHVGDTITMRRLRYTSSGLYEAVEEVSWFVDQDSILKRSCKSLIGLGTEDCPTDNPNIVDIAENITRFTITPSKPSTTVTTVNILPTNSETEKNFRFVARFGEENIEPINMDPEEGGEEVRLSGFYMNYDFDTNEPFHNPDMIKANQVFLATTGSAVGSWSSQCEKVTLAPFIEYEISFTMPYDVTKPDNSRMFCPGRDHMTVGFRYTENGKKPNGISDFQFYPPTVGDDRDTGFRKMRFTTKDTIKNVCLGFTFANFSPIASSGNISFKEVKLKKIPSSNYTFSNDPIATVDKKNVKAIKMELSIKINGEEGTQTAIIAIPSNGPRD